jgi:stage II sporulation protein AA (anti-sigma F factor antagonist)
MEIGYEVEGVTLYIHLPKELDHHSSKDLREDSDILIEKYRIQNLVFDFAITDFMDSSGIGILLGRYKKMKALGGKVYLQNVGQRAEKILNMAGILDLICQTNMEDL